MGWLGATVASKLAQGGQDTKHATLSMKRTHAQLLSLCIVQRAGVLPVSMAHHDEGAGQDRCWGCGRCICQGLWADRGAAKGLSRQQLLSLCSLCPINPLQSPEATEPVPDGPQHLQQRVPHHGEQVACCPSQGVWLSAGHLVSLGSWLLAGHAASRRSTR